MYLIWGDFMRLKSVKFKTLACILPCTLCAIILLSVLSYQYSKKIINNEIQTKVNCKLDQAVENIQGDINLYSSLPLNLSRIVETLGNSASKQQYQNLLVNSLSVNTNSYYGTGIWFEPYKYHSDEKYYGPYACWDKDRVVYTEEYSNANYDYFKYDWYKMAKDTKELTVWSDPFLDDVSKVTMITVASPFYDKDKNFMGSITADVNLSSIQKSVSSIKIGKTGEAFLLNKNGMYIVNSDASKIMKVNIASEKKSRVS